MESFSSFNHNVWRFMSIRLNCFYRHMLWHERKGRTWKMQIAVHVDCQFRFLPVLPYCTHDCIGSTQFTVYEPRHITTRDRITTQAQNNTQGGKAATIWSTNKWGTNPERGERGISGLGKTVASPHEDFQENLLWTTQDVSPSSCWAAAEWSVLVITSFTGLFFLI